MILGFILGVATCLALQLAWEYRDVLQNLYQRLIDKVKPK